VRRPSQFLREVEHALKGVGGDDAVDQPRLQRRLGADRIAGDDHLQRQFGAHRAWQPLRAAGSRQQPDSHFRQAQARVRRRHPVVAGER
jgi:hypothetical protein